MVAVLPVRLQQRIASSLGLLDGHSASAGVAAASGTGTLATAACCAALGLGGVPAALLVMQPGHRQPAVVATITAHGRLVTRHSCPGSLGRYDHVDNFCRELFYDGRDGLARTLQRLGASRMVGRTDGRVSGTAMLSDDHIVRHLYPGAGNPALHSVLAETCRLTTRRRTTSCVRHFAET